MTTYGGFDPGTFQPWALNLTQNVLGSSGIGRGMVVQPTNPAGLSVQVSVDPIAGDGVLFLANGAWLRIDATTTLTVPGNSSGSTRTDAVVAFVDPTGVGGAPSLTYQTSWASGFKPGTNQFVLALVNVPNAATSVIAANIVNTQLVANVGGAPPVTLDAVVSDASPAAQQALVFSQFNLLLSSAATNGQTSFAVPLTGFQKLVPMGKIGGVEEVGYFSGPQGWYVPKVFGSTSGNLPVQSVDIIGGNIVLAQGAVSGEQVVASLKLYDFSRDLQVWAGTRLLDRNSPYIVYQGDLGTGTIHLTDDIWDGTQNGSLPREVGLPLIVTYFGYQASPDFAPIASGFQFSYSFDGAAPTTVSPPFSSDIGPVGYATALTPAGATVDGIHQLTLTYVANICEFGGVDVMCVQPALYVDGGQAIVDGLAVPVTNTSFQLGGSVPGQAATVYVDRFANVTTSVRTQTLPLAEEWGGRVPIAQALQYGGLTTASTMYGTYTLPGSPKAQPTYVMLGAFAAGAPAQSGNGRTHGWTLSRDAASAYGGYMTTSFSQDAIAIAAICTGLDLLGPLTSTASLSISVDNATTFTKLVAPQGSGSRVRTTLMSSWPLGYHFCRVVSQTSGVGFGAEAVDLRIPTLPTPPAQTLPLATAYVTSYSSYIRKGMLHDASLNSPSGTAQLMVDVDRGAAGASLLLSNVSSNETYAQVVHSSGAYRVSYMLAASHGKFTINLDGVSTVSTVDSYATVSQMTQTGWFTLSDQKLHTLQLVGTGTKNTSSSGLIVQFGGIDFLAPPILVLNTQRYGNDGLRPSIRPTALLSSKGDAVNDAPYGLLPQHLADRAVTSRKVAPTFQRMVAQTQWSGTPGVDPNLQLTVLVEVPSMLLLTYASSPLCNANGFAAINFNVDGIATGTGMVCQNPTASNGIRMMLSCQDIAVVGPGAHLITTTLGNGGGATNPYFDGGTGRYLTVLAFAL